MALTPSQYAASEGWLNGSLQAWSIAVSINGRDPKVPPAIWALVEEFVRTGELSQYDYQRLINHAASAIGYLPPVNEPAQRLSATARTYKADDSYDKYRTGTFRPDGSRYMDMSRISVKSTPKPSAAPIDYGLSYNDAVEFLDKAVKQIKAHKYYQIALIVVGLLLLSWITGIG